MPVTVEPHLLLGVAEGDQQDVRPDIVDSVHNPPVRFLRFSQFFSLNVDNGRIDTGDPQIRMALTEQRGRADCHIWVPAEKVEGFISLRGFLGQSGYQVGPGHPFFEGRPPKVC